MVRFKKSLKRYCRKTYCMGIIFLCKTMLMHLKELILNLAFLFFIRDFWDSILDGGVCSKIIFVLYLCHNFTVKNF